MKRIVFRTTTIDYIIWFFANIYTTENNLSASHTFFSTRKWNNLKHGYTFLYVSDRDAKMGGGNGKRKGKGYYAPVQLQAGIFGYNDSIYTRRLVNGQGVWFTRLSYKASNTPTYTSWPAQGRFVVRIHHVCPTVEVARK